MRPGVLACRKACDRVLPDGSPPKAQKARRQHEAQLADVQYSIHIGTFELNLATQDLVWSDEHYRLCRAAASQKSARLSEAISHVHPDDLPTLRSVVEGAIAGAGLRAGGAGSLARRQYPLDPQQRPLCLRKRRRRAPDVWWELRSTSPD